MIRFGLDDFSREFQSILSYNYKGLCFADEEYLAEFNCTEHSLWWEVSDERHIDDDILQNFDWSDEESV